MPPNLALPGDGAFESALGPDDHQTNIATIAGVIANGSVHRQYQPGNRRLHFREDRGDDRQERRRPLEREGHNVGLVLFGLRSDFERREWDGDLLQPIQRALHALPILGIDCESASPSAKLACHDRTARPGQSSILPGRFLWNLVANGGTLPAVTFLKATSSQTGHPANSTPLEEQAFLVQTINFLQSLPQWSNMAILITYDDSDGWYDHVTPPIVSPSADASLDTLAGTSGMCGTLAAGSYNDRCGYGPSPAARSDPRPFARQNFDVDHTVADQSLDLALHRGQLAVGTNWRSVVRCNSWTVDKSV